VYKESLHDVACIEIELLNWRLCNMMEMILKFKVSRYLQDSRVWSSDPSSVCIHGEPRPRRRRARIGGADVFRCDTFEEQSDFET
jgi:hypothetical protein